MWGLEYALLFGVPNNKLELIRGRSHCAFPFRDRAAAEAHYQHWIDTLCRWKGVENRPAVQKQDGWLKVEAADFRLDLAPLPIALEVPLAGDLFGTFSRLAWRRECWPGQPKGCERGWESVQSHYDVLLNLWQLFGDLCERHGGVHGGRVDVHLSPTTAVAPDQYYFRKSRKDNLIAGDYHKGAPQVVAEVLSPASRWVDRGPRKDLYEKAGVSWLWLLEPTLETLEVHELASDGYHLAGCYRPGDAVTSPLFPGERIAVEPLFTTQRKRWRERDGEADEPEPVPEWVAPPERKLGLEYLFQLGHPERRFELWNNRAPCMLPFGSAAEARKRLRDFVEDACRWEGRGGCEPETVDGDVEQAEVGRFRLARNGRHVHLDVALDGRKYRQLLEAWADREAWDWGEPATPRKASG